MEELKIHIPHVMLWEVKNDKNTTETTKKISSVYDQGVLLTAKSETGFQSFVLVIRH